MQIALTGGTGFIGNYLTNKFVENDFKSKMLVQVHDELVFEVPKNELDSLKSIVINKMENALSLSVPIIVDCGHGKSWFEAH